MPAWMEDLKNPNVNDDRPQTPWRRWVIGPTLKAEESFREKYADLRNYRQFYGHCRVPATSKKLHGFVMYMRKLERRKALWRHWKEDLELIGFDFVLRVYAKKGKQQDNRTRRKQNPELQSCSKEEYMKRYKNLVKQHKFSNRHLIYLTARQIKEALLRRPDDDTEKCWLPITPLPDDICKKSSHTFHHHQ